MKQTSKIPNKELAKNWMRTTISKTIAISKEILFQARREYRTRNRKTMKIQIVEKLFFRNMQNCNVTINFN